MNAPEFSGGLTIANTEIVTDRLRLHFPRTDAEMQKTVQVAFTAAHSPANEQDRSFTEGMTWEPPETPEIIREFMEAQKSKWGIDVYNFSIWNITGEVIGNCGIHLAADSEKSLYEYSIGYWLEPKHHGKGFMKEAAKALVTFGFKQLGANTIGAKAMHWNTASQTVLMSTGMQKIITEQPMYYEKNGIDVEQYAYVITRDQFTAQ